MDDADRACKINAAYGKEVTARVAKEVPKPLTGQEIWMQQIGNSLFIYQGSWESALTNEVAMAQKLTKHIETDKKSEKYCRVGYNY